MLRFFAVCALLGLVKTTDLPVGKYAISYSAVSGCTDVYFTYSEPLNNRNGDPTACSIIGTCLELSGAGQFGDYAATYHFTPKHAGKATIAFIYSPEKLSDAIVYISVFEVDKDLNVTLKSMKEVIR
ncbi:MAG: hypothetical protein IJT27_07255 [Clostridia bacterium]|nr:hypothetical protein [Clostridia bacterium]